MLPAGCAALVLAALLSGCAAGASDRPQVHARPLPLQEDAPQRTEVGALRYLAGFVLSGGGARFGGFSGLHVTADGRRLTALVDRGVLWQAELEHDGQGVLTGFAGWRQQRLTPPPGTAGLDTEALTPYGDAELALAYEDLAAIHRLPWSDLAAAPRPLPTAPAIPAQRSTGLESLTTLGGGSLLAIAEGIAAPAGGVRAWRIWPERVAELRYLPATGFAPTDAATHAGMLYVLERRLSLLGGGFTSRLVALPASAAQPGAALAGRELARLGWPLLSENFEALAVRRGPDGRVLLYLLSDDNFNLLQRTLLLQFALDPAALAAAR